MAVRSSSEPLSALSPQSCITDAFTEDTRWSSIRSGQGRDVRSGYDSYAADNEEDDWETSRSCTETCIDDDDGEATSPCETATNWDGVTIIDDNETVTSCAEEPEEEEELGSDTYCETPTTIVIAPPPPTTAPPPPPPAAIAQEDSGKEVVMSPVISCRINTIANLDFPAYLPTPKEPTARSADVRPSPPPAAPLQRPTPSARPAHAATDPLTISRQAMRQEWTETPPMKLDLAKLEGTPIPLPSLPPPPPQRSTTPINNNNNNNNSSSSSSSSRPGTGTSAGRKESPLPWLTSRSASPARSIDEIRKSTEEVKRTRSPRGWKLW